MKNKGSEIENGTQLKEGDSLEGSAHDTPMHNPHILPLIYM